MRAWRATTTGAGVLLASNARAAAGAGDETTVRVRVRNVTALPAEVKLGHTAAAAAGDTASYPWAGTEGPLELDLEPGEELYAAGTAQTIAVLERGRR